jgi:hypothetical protein
MAFDTPATLVTTDVLTLARYNKLKDSIIANSHATFDLGGSRVVAIPVGGGVQDAPEYAELMVPTSTYGGYVYKVECEIRTEDAATTVTPRLYNITDAAVAWTGSAGTSTAWGTYQLSSSVTIAAGKRYRLQATKSDDAVEAWVIGRIVRTHA